MKYLHWTYFCQIGQQCHRRFRCIWTPHNIKWTVSFLTILVSIWTSLVESPNLLPLVKGSNSTRFPICRANSENWGKSHIDDRAISILELRVGMCAWSICFHQHLPPSLPPPHILRRYSWLNALLWNRKYVTLLGWQCYVELDRMILLIQKTVFFDFIVTK